MLATCFCSMLPELRLGLLVCTCMRSVHLAVAIEIPDAAQKIRQKCARACGVTFISIWRLGRKDRVEGFPESCSSFVNARGEISGYSVLASRSHMLPMRWERTVFVWLNIVMKEVDIKLLLHQLLEVVGSGISLLRTHFEHPASRR